MIDQAYIEEMAQWRKECDEEQRLERQKERKRKEAGKQRWQKNIQEWANKQEDKPKEVFLNHKRIYKKESLITQGEMEKEQDFGIEYFTLLT